MQARGVMVTDNNGFEECEGGSVILMQRGYRQRHSVRHWSSCRNHARIGKDGLDFRAGRGTQGG